MLLSGWKDLRALALSGLQIWPPPLPLHKSLRASTPELFDWCLRPAEVLLPDGKM
jgi:hypothetical protein